MFAIKGLSKTNSSLSLNKAKRLRTFNSPKARLGGGHLMTLGQWTVVAYTQATLFPRNTISKKLKIY